MLSFNYNAPKEKKVKVETPNMEKICEAVNDPKSKYYYPTLLKKYEAQEQIIKSLQEKIKKMECKETKFLYTPF